jgi:hypothetical protein
MKKTSFGLTPFLMMLITVSCNNTDTEQPGAEPQPADTSMQFTQTTPLENVAPPDSYVTIDTNESVRILNATTYHGDELEEAVDQQSWIGLYVDKPHYFLEETTVHAERVNDPIVDTDENDKTGWEISDTHPAENLILMRGLSVETGEVIHSRLSAHEVLPGDTITFVLEGKSFELFATGNNVDQGGYSTVENYKLFLRGEKNGKTVTQLLVAHDNFDDAMVSVIFAGDIDRDHFPDFLMDNARHYNANNPTLYLSSGVATNALVQIVGWHYSVGC